MIKHIVFFQMKDEHKLDNAKELGAQFRAISEKIPGVLACETGLNVNHEERHYDLCLNQAFENPEALDAYLNHPLHLEVRTFAFQVIDHRIVVDYEA